MIAVVVDAIFLVLNFLGSVLFISPWGQTGPKTMLFIWWIWYIGQYGVSLGNVCMFESPNIFLFNSTSKESNSSRIILTTYNETKSDSV